VNGFDMVLAVLAGLLVLLGLLQGLTRLLIGIGALIAAFVLAAQFHEALVAKLGWIDVPAPARKLLAYLTIFLGTMLAGGLLAWIVRRLVKAAMLSWTDRLAGGALGLVAAMLVAALVVLPLVAYSPLGEQTLRDSVLAPYVVAVADLANHLVPADLAEAYRKKVGTLREYWRDRGTV
jgi:membrane protein required for colicin V production